MLKKDRIFQSFLQHEILKESYEISPEYMTYSLREGLQAKEPIVNTIAQIITMIEDNGASERQIYDRVSKSLHIVL